VELWDRSVARSRHRRKLAELSRKHRRRRQSASLAVSAAVATTPILPSLAAADGATHGTAPGTGEGGSSQAGERTLLHEGSTGTLVAALQRRLNVGVAVHRLAVDGIFGPLTRGAVLDYQHRHGLRPSGLVDADMWAVLFDSPVLELAPAAAPSARTTSAVLRTKRHAPARSPQPHRATPRRHAAPRAARTTRHEPKHAAARRLVVVSPPHVQAHRVSYVMSDGVALPLPARYLTGGYIDQGVDYSAPGGTPLYAMGDGVIIRTGIDGFGPNAPVLKITSGPLAGLIVYYGHSGPNSVRVGQRVRAGQRISQVGYGIVGISTGPHLEIGFYPLGSRGAGSPMLRLINRLLHSRHHSHHRRAATSAAVYRPTSSGSSSSSTRSTYSPRAYSSSASSAQPAREPLTYSRPTETTAPAHTSSHRSRAATASPSASPKAQQTTSSASSASPQSSQQSAPASSQRSTAPAPSPGSAPAAHPAAEPAKTAPASSPASPAPAAATSPSPAGTPAPAQHVVPSTSTPAPAPAPTPATPQAPATGVAAAGAGGQPTAAPSTEPAPVTTPPGSMGTTPPTP
jgi:hypothetical protein